ncbi:MAG TPA: transaldolase [Candidatus Saccharimonadales bacterium]|nr:transaldolase [Candidatus Saccharimonadales bacterium]
MTTTSTIPNVGAGQGTNPVKGLLAYGQSPWLDFIQRNILLNGELKRLIAEDGLRGMTSNPAIFEKAIGGASTDYNDILSSPEAKTLDAKGLYEKIAIRDVQDATDIFKAVYDESKRYDGYVSLEVSPTLANNTKDTIEEARRLWKTVNRENLMVKVPATPEGIPAIRQLIEDGININITLLFAQSAYEKVAEAFIAGLEARAAKGEDVSKIASVASFFVSRIDTLIDGTLDEKLKTATDPAQSSLFTSLQGKVAIANAKLTYRKYQEICASGRWKALAAKGAQTQRLLWASTSTKNKKYRDVVYVEELIGKDTVDTIPPATFDAFRDHGKLRNSLVENVEAAQKTMDDLAKAGISMKEVTEKLVTDGVKLFADAFVKLLDATGKSAGVKA